MSKFRFNKSKTKQLNVRIDNETLAFIELISLSESVEKTETIRELLRVGLEVYENECKQSQEKLRESLIKDGILKTSKQDS